MIPPQLDPPPTARGARASLPALRVPPAVVRLAVQTALPDVVLAQCPELLVGDPYGDFLDVLCVGSNRQGREAAADRARDRGDEGERSCVLAVDLAASGLQGLLASLAHAAVDMDVVALSAQPVFSPGPLSAGELFAAAHALWGGRILPSARFLDAVGRPVVGVEPPFLCAQLLALQIPVRRARLALRGAPSCLVDAGSRAALVASRFEVALHPDLAEEARVAVLQAEERYVAAGSALEWTTSRVVAGPRPS